MPAKTKTGAKPKSAPKKVDQVELLDKALEECNGLKDWIASILGDVKNLREKADKNENTENSVKTKKANKSKKQTYRNKNKLKGKTEKEAYECDTAKILASSTKNCSKLSMEKPMKTLKTATTAAIALKESTKPSNENLKHSPQANKQNQKRAKKDKKPIKKPTKLELSTESSSSVDSDYGSSSNLEPISESCDSIEPLLDAEALRLIGRSSQECLSTYSKVNKRYIEVKRSMDSLMVDLNRVNVIMNRQHNVFHGGVLSTGSKTHVCHH